jgi:hypothetical protein
MISGSNPPSGNRGLARAAVVTLAFAALLAGATGLARWMQFAYAHPTVAEYAAHHGGKVKIFPAGQLSFDGESFQCGRFPTVMSAALDDDGAAFFGFILLNPVRFPQMPMTLKRYAYAHECGHQYVGYDEGEADCYAVRRGRAEGWLDAKALDEICDFIGRAKGDGVHALGTRRCDMMRRCYARSRPGREPLELIQTISPASTFGRQTPGAR